MSEDGSVKQFWIVSYCWKYPSGHETGYIYDNATIDETPWDWLIARRGEGRETYNLLWAHRIDRETYLRIKDTLDLIPR
jgi:hypothetical protein